MGEEHWAQRETFMQVDYPEVGRTLTQVGAKWVAPGLPWRTGPRAPLLGEHNAEVLTDATVRKAPAICTSEEAPLLSKHGKPFALSGVRIVDLTWMLASAGAGRSLHRAGRRGHQGRAHLAAGRYAYGHGKRPLGGRAERDGATGPIVVPPTKNVDRSGSFMEINSGKRSLSLNLKHPRAKELLIEPHQRCGYGDRRVLAGNHGPDGPGLRAAARDQPEDRLRPAPGMGQIGTYGRLRSFGPTAQAFSGLSDMSGLPDPYPPAGIGYSYLDWFGAYQMALAMMAALYRQKQNRQGLLDRFRMSRSGSISPVPPSWTIRRTAVGGAASGTDALQIRGTPWRIPRPRH